MSSEFRAKISDRVHSALEFRARDGRAAGGKPFGDAELVKEIFQRFADGESLKKIASDLNARDPLPVPHGRLVSLGILSAEVAGPSIEAAKRKNDANVQTAPVVALWPSAKAWRDAAMRMRNILVGDNVPAARDVRRDMIGTIPCEPTPGGVFMSWTTGQTLIQSGTDRVRFCGSGGTLRYLSA
jgi:hypothetical protein